MVDVEGGNNMIYLPLDKMLNNADVSRGAVQKASRLMDDMRNNTFDTDNVRTRSSRTREAR